ncbi:flagella basal body P-ring formation protein FlgA [Bdellovibrio sp. qaytius]|nr:flagella basal body P-ring formation protein FlgA [Bdellovibrio sp. qaytius]
MKKLVLISLMFVSQIALAKSEITLSSAIEVSPREVITAYDIVEGRNLSEDTLSDLKAIELGNAQTKTISKLEIIKKFRGLESNFRLPTEVKILRSKSNVSRLEIERKVMNHLLAKCGTCEYRIQINSVPQNLLTDWELDMNVDFNKSTVMIPAFSTSAPEKKGWVVVELKKYANVPVLTRPLKIGDVITDDAVTTEMRLMQSYQDAIMDVKSVVGMQASRYLTMGQTLSSKDLKREQILKKGQMVKAIFGADALEISISAQAEEGGAVGDVVKVKNLDSQKMFAAKIIDRGVVRIE